MTKPRKQTKPAKTVRAANGNGATAADRMHKQHVEHSRVIRHVCENPARRKRLEKDPAKWLKWYLAETFTRDFEKPHHEIIDGTMNAHRTLGKFAVAGERGIGKSVILWGMVLFLNFTGQQKFPADVPWAAPALKRAFKFWKNALSFNRRLSADYPEFCDPFVHAKGVSQRVATTVWADNGEPTGAQLSIGDGIIALPDSLGCLGGATINGNIRGLNFTQADGTVIRPSIVLLDDVQDRKVAKSQQQVSDTISIIDSDVAGCGEAGRDMPMLMACNCIVKDDVTCHYLNSNEWHALRVSCVEQWPEGWEDPQSECRTLWEEWYERFRDNKADISFYKEHKPVMTKGMRLSAPSVFKGASKCPDAFYGVMRMYYRMGHEAFMAERQQTPIDPIEETGPYAITPALIVSRSVKRQRYDRPEWVNLAIASTDVNPSYALSTVLQGFGGDQSCAYMSYGFHRMAIPGGIPQPEFSQRLFAELVAHGKEIAAQPIKPEAWAIDAGGAQFDTVVRFCGESVRLCGIQAYAFAGKGGKEYRPYGKTMVPGQKREQCHGCLDRKDGRVIKWVAWNSHYWKEICQRAWLGEVNAPGSASLFDGQHGEFAAQMCGEKLMGKGEIGGQMMWNWHTCPGKHDILDAASQGYALAAVIGIGSGGQVVKQQKAAYFVSHRK